MRIIKNIMFSFITLFVVIIIILLIPPSHAYILSKLTTYFLHVNTHFSSAEIGWNRYSISASLDGEKNLFIYADYKHLNKAKIDVDFKGDIACFSKVATLALPHIDIDLNMTLDHMLQLKAQATILKGSMQADFDINTLQYNLQAENISLFSYQNQQAMDPYIDGFISLSSQGSLENIIDINLTLDTNKMRLLPLARESLNVDTNGSPILVSLSTSISFKDTQLDGELEIDSNIMDLNMSSFEYDINKNSFDIALLVKNNIKKYEPLDSLHVRTSGSYRDKKLLAEAVLDIDGYIIDLNKLNYKDDGLHVKYALSSAEEEFVDINGTNRIYGTLSHTPQKTEVDITSALLADSLDIIYTDDNVELRADALSLSGLLKHLKQEAFASANIALHSDINLSKTVQFNASIDTLDLKLSEKLEKILGANTPIALHVKASGDDNNMLAQTRIDSNIMQLSQSDIIYDLNQSLLHVKGVIHDLNISLYHAPTLKFESQIDLNAPLHVSTFLDSDFEDINLTLVKDQDMLSGTIDFDFDNINRMHILKDIYHVGGVITFNSDTKQHLFDINLSDVNTSYYQASFMDINGSVTQNTLLYGDVDIHTPYEKLALQFNHDANQSDVDFVYDIAQLHRFAVLNPHYDINGSGKLSITEQDINLDIDSKQFGPIHIQKDAENIALDIDNIALSEVFLLTNQKAIIDANISLIARLTPEHLQVKLDSPWLYPLEENTTLRPTPLHVRLDLDGNMSAYEGELSMQTSYENVMLENLKLHMNNNKYSSDFFIQSHDLEKGVVILPDILVDKTRFDGNFTYNESAVLHVNNSAMYFSEAFHQKIDANASGKLHLELLLDLKYHKNMLDIALTSQSPYYDIHTFNTQIDLNQSLLLSTLEMTTNQAQDTGVVNLKMHYTNPYHIDAILKTKYEQIEFKNVMVDINNTDINGTYTIALQQTPKKALFQHGLAKFKGAMTNKPLPKATLHSNSFDGVFNIIATQKNITIDADAISLEKVMNFLDTKSALQAGVLDIDVSLESDNFLELNITSLKGDISLDATELILEGFDADKSINTLKNYQDISIFDGNIPGMGIVSSIVKAPVNLVSQHEIPKSEITQVHIDSYLENGMFYCYDCALKTEENRIALKGAIDINSTNFHYFEVGLLKDNGCAFFTQDIKGSVKKPDIALSKTSLSLVTGTIKSVGGVVKDGVNFGTSLISKTGALVGEGIDMTTGKIPLVNKATGAVSGTLVGVSGAPDSANNALTIQCQPFYRGVVSHPQTFISH